MSKTSSTRSGETEQDDTPLIPPAATKDGHGTMTCNAVRSKLLRFLLCKGTHPTFTDDLVKEVAFVRLVSDLTSIRQARRFLSTSRRLNELEEPVFCGYKLPEITSWSEIPVSGNTNLVQANKEGKALLRALTGTPNSRWLSLLDTSEVQKLSLPMNMSDEEMLRLFGGGRFSQLTELDCGGSGGITDVSATAVAQACPHLQALAITYADGISIRNAGLTELARGCPELRNLNLNGGSEITDSGVIELARGCSKLRMLDLGGYPRAHRVTDVGIKELALKCPDLFSIDIENGHISTACINALKQTHPKLIIFVGDSDDDY